MVLIQDEDNANVGTYRKVMVCKTNGQVGSKTKTIINLEGFGDRIFNTVKRFAVIRDETKPGWVRRLASSRKDAVKDSTWVCNALQRGISNAEPPSALNTVCSKPVRLDSFNRLRSD